MPTVTPMPKYRCHTEVWALKIKAIEPEKMPTFTGATCRGSYALGTACGNCERCKWEREHGGVRKLGWVITPEEPGFDRFFVASVYVASEHPKVGGYYVEHDDSSKSFATAEAFESEYTPLRGEFAFEEELARVINCHSKENESNTPDFVLSSFLRACLTAFASASRAREKWYGKELKPGGGA